MTETDNMQITIPRVPFPWAVTLVVILSLPLTFYLGRFNFPVWVCFIVWAEYFTLGGTPKTARLILPSLPFGAIFGVLWVATAIFYTNITDHPQNLFVGLIFGSLWITLLVYLIPKSSIFSEGMLAVFNGLTIFLAVYFTKSIPDIGPMENPYWSITNAFIWSMAMSYVGWFFGLLNIFFTFPRKAEQ
ncbi:DUF1097 domain-containing protein [Desulforhopalus singaporensis]|uniref:DUF1097 domain-containing protein n=1 Tax=Desulforhopalus singaporensis TaxID=91360 RepID=A0A1H0N2X7_9BACT|nr:DUF1097 domain-containing protein [Desulforhopalus singaporensis]SDO87069.1 Protein of unknown function [Desulforhopalus singaporensis]